MVPVVQLMCCTTLLTLFSQAVSEHEQGKMMGSAAAGFGLSFAINAALIGILAMLHLNTPILVAALLLFASVILMLKYRAPA